MVTLSLSKSGKAVLVHCDDGSTSITSVKFLELLLEGKLKGNLLVAARLGDASNKFGGLVKGESKGGSGVVASQDVVLD